MPEANIIPAVNDQNSLDYYAFASEHLPKWQNVSKFKVSNTKVQSLENKENFPMFCENAEQGKVETPEVENSGGETLVPVTCAEETPGCITTSHIRISPSMLRKKKPKMPLREKLLRKLSYKRCKFPINYLLIVLLI